MDAEKLILGEGVTKYLRPAPAMFENIKNAVSNFLFDSLLAFFNENLRGD
jgi:hypothetical protein